MSTDTLKPAAFEVLPALDTFAKTYGRGAPQVVWTRLVSDLETPVSAYMKVAQGRPMTFLLESVEGGAVRGRYSMIGLAPDLVWRANGNAAEINRTPAKQLDQFKPLGQPTLEALRTLLAESAIDLPEDLPPMAAGVFGHMGYDTVRLVEHLPDVPPDVLGVSDMVLIRPTVIIVFDTVKDEMTVVTPVRPAPRTTAASAYTAAVKRLKSVVDALEAPLPHGSAAANAPRRPERRSRFQHQAGGIPAMVAKAKEYIRAGDAFQIVLSQRFSVAVRVAAVRALPRAAPHQPLAIPLSPATRRLCAGRLEPGDPGARPRRRGDDPPARRHAPARGHRERGRRRLPNPC